MEITKLYLCESTILIIRFNQALLEHNCHFFPMGVVTLYSFVKAPLDSLNEHAFLNIFVLKNLENVW